MGEPWQFWYTVRFKPEDRSLIENSNRHWTDTRTRNRLKKIFCSNGNMERSCQPFLAPLAIWWWTAEFCRG
jgi:hypothetical protein